MPAKLPEKFINPKPGELSELAVGESAYLSCAWMYLTTNGDAYLKPNAELAGPYPQTIRVERRQDGFHVALVDKSTKWEPGKSERPWFESDIPVASITEDFDPQLDSRRIVEAMEQISRKLDNIQPREPT